MPEQDSGSATATAKQSAVPGVLVPVVRLAHGFPSAPRLSVGEPTDALSNQSFDPLTRHVHKMPASALKLREG